MKKITLFLALFAVLNSLNAQYPAGPADGSIAPNFTATDINGNVHKLNNYLAAGKTVFIEMSGANCAPGWQYHATGAMQDFYYAYGPQGSNEIMVLWITNGFYETLEDINGSKPHAMGDFTDGTTFPIILNQSAYNLYTDNSVPDIFRICPNGQLTKYFKLSSTWLKSVANQCQPLTGVQNHARIIAPVIENGFCAATGNFDVTIKNYGTNDLANLVLTLRENGSIVSTKSFSGLAIAQFSSTTLQFDPVTINPASIYTATVESVNGVQNRIAALSSATLPFHTTKIAVKKNLKVKIHTDNCPQTMSWQITNSAGTVITSGGPYQGGTNGNCGGPYYETIISKSVSFPTTPDCYTITLKDSGGMGWKNYGQVSADNPHPTTGIRITNTDNTLIYSKLDVGNFGSSLVLENAFSIDTTLGEDEVEDISFKAYPNPSKGFISFSTDEPLSVILFDVMGKQVYSAENVTQYIPLDISTLSNGVYMAKLETVQGETSVQKIVLDK